LQNFVQVSPGRTVFVTMNANPMCRKGDPFRFLSLRCHPRLPLGRGLALVVLLLVSALTLRAQTTILFEGFEGAFPGSWSVGDTNAAGGTNYWKDVNSSFGSITARTGNWKGYCAGILNGSVNPTNRYTNSMAAYMARSVSLAGYTGANLEFWYAIPSIETCCDSFRVYLDNTQVFAANTPTPGWTLVSAPLNDYLAGSHTVSFQFNSDPSVINEGAYLDDISIRGSTAPLVSTLQTLQNINYSGYILASDPNGFRTNLQAQTVFNVENFTGTNVAYSNVLSYRFINAASNLPHPILDVNATTNLAYTYSITNVVTLAAGTNAFFTNTAFIRPAALVSHLSNYYIECRLLTNGVLAQTLTTAPATYWHFTNTVSGDASLNVLGRLNSAGWSQTYAVQSVPGENSFVVDTDYELRRWDDIGSGATVNIPVVLNYTLKDSTGNTIPLTRSSDTFYDALPGYQIIFFFQPVTINVTRSLNIRPSIQLDSVNKTYYLTVTLAHTNNLASGQTLTANSLPTTTTELLHFNGNLLFGTSPIITATMDNLGVAPPANPPVAGSIPTTLNGLDGHVTSKPSHTFAGAGPIGVKLQVNGDAVVASGSLVLNAPAQDTDSFKAVNFLRGPITLNSSGAFADVKLTLPRGMGYRTNDTVSRVIYPSIQFTGVALNSTLVPAADQVFFPGLPLFVVEESKPVWNQTDKIIWHVSSGGFDFPSAGVGAIYVRANEYAYLQSVSNNLVDPVEMGDKRSNDKYWLALTGASANPTVRTDVNSNALLSASFNFGNGAFRAHFPYDTVVQWTGAGGLKVSDDLVVQGSSSLSGASPVSVPYTRDCPDCGGAGAGITTPSITPSNAVFNFTRDGGLVAGGLTVGTVNLQWGYIGSPTLDYAQQAFGFTEGAFHMPGVFVRGDQNSLPLNQGATTILYSGFAVSNLNVIERPLTAAYSRGLADYAGLNFRCLNDGAHGARSTIAGTKNINWQLDARSKYYVRYAGVDGIHEAVPGTFPTNLTLWGYKFTFTSYGLSYLDSLNKDSRTDGAIDLPYPAQFVQGFNNMKFSCLGAPLSGDVPQGDGFKLMAYWSADFKTHSIQFKSNNSCSPGTGYLVLGIEGYASHVDKPLFGYVGFFNNGDQIPKSFGLDGVDSRLKLPNVIKMEGPNKSTYSYTPVADAYYNAYAGAPPLPTAGWISVYGKLDVPFFMDMQIQLQTSCHTNGASASNAPIYLAGGWKRPGSSNPNHGWLNATGKTPFETNFFDWSNRGWPTVGGLTIENYRNNATGEDYHPRAQKLWLGVVDFDYPMSWNFTLRSFKSWQERTNDLLVLKVQHQVKYLDAKQAEIDFGAQYDGLPKISIANMAFNAIDEATGVGAAVVKAAAQPVEDLLSAGLDEMNQMLDTQMNRLMDGVFAKTVDPIVDTLYNNLSNQWANNWYTLTIPQRQQFLTSLSSNLNKYLVGDGSVANNLSAALLTVGSPVNEANNLIGQVEGYLRDATNAICSVVGVINTTTNGLPIGSNVVGLIAQVGGDRPIIPKLMNGLVGELAPQFIDALIGPTVSNIIKDLEPALQQIQQTLNQTKDTISQVSAQLGPVGDFTKEVDDTIHGYSAEITNVSLHVSIAVTQFFGKLDFSVDNPFQHVSAVDVKKFIRQKIEDEFFATTAAAQVQTILRQRLYDLDAALREQIDSVFQEVNGALRNVISQSLAELDNSINGALGEISDVMGAGKIDGHALIVGDSLKLLRLDGHFQWKAPDSLEFDAYLQIKEYDSDGTPGCSSSSGSFTEVTLGANHVPLKWVSPDLQANIGAKFTFDGTVPFPVNFGGSLELIGDLSFEAFILHDLAAAVAFGKYENYIALKGGVRFDGYDFSGAIFFGRTCSLDPLLLIDPDVAGVLGNPPFTGAYVYAQGWLPISELVLGIPASCLFEISAGVGAGAFYFAEGPTYGGKMFLGVSGELLCIVSIEGDITLIGVKHGDDLRFKGHGHFEAEVGPCPFCISVSKDVGVSYINKKWNLD
jgi:hypothetical protein